MAERSAASEAAFRVRLKGAGATLLEPAWLGVDAPHRIRCRAGHEVSPTPTNVKRGGEVCRTCAHRDTAAAETGYRAHLDAIGATAMWSEWRGGHKAHHVRCAAGHDCYPLWINVQRGTGICRACARQDPAISERAFRELLASLGADLVGDYANARRPVQVRCAAGHDCYPTPDNVRRGQGVCSFCANRIWDAFYVVAHVSEPRVKFGITSGKAKARLYQHRRAGYATIHLLRTGLPGQAARHTENTVRAALDDAGEHPIKGREYFDVSCLGLILDVAEHWLNDTTGGMAAAQDEDKLDRLEGILAGWDEEA
jgi:hypothetical protein